jgi:hypothetical protein
MSLSELIMKKPTGDQAIALTMNTPKVKEHEEIERLTKEYLARNGLQEVPVVPIGASAEAGLPFQVALPGSQTPTPITLNRVPKHTSIHRRSNSGHQNITKGTTKEGGFEVTVCSRFRGRFQDINDAIKCRDDQRLLIGLPPAEY